MSRKVGCGRTRCWIEPGKDRLTCLEGDCEYTTASVTGMRLHMRLSHEKDIEKKPEDLGLGCGVCFATFPDKRGMENHYRASGH